jgi:hypothetical protein
VITKNITFSSAKDYTSLKSYLPKPIKLNIPEWYKKLSHAPHQKTIKGCMPFLDTLTTGYVLSLPQDFTLKHNIVEKTDEGFKRCTSLEAAQLHNKHEISFNIRNHAETHGLFQVKGSPQAEKNLHLPVHKFLNPWLINTPPGYSCLFVPPLNNNDDRFSIIPGIVNTDTYSNEINFPFIVNGDKYPVLDTILEAGTPYVQVIPFKRDSWKMNIKEYDKEKHHKNIFKFNLKWLHAYKDRFWNKVSWK